MNATNFIVQFENAISRIAVKANRLRLFSNTTELQRVCTNSTENVVHVTMARTC